MVNRVKKPTSTYPAFEVEEVSFVFCCGVLQHATDDIRDGSTRFLNLGLSDLSKRHFPLLREKKLICLNIVYQIIDQERSGERQRDNSLLYDTSLLLVKCGHLLVQQNEKNIFLY